MLKLGRIFCTSVVSPVTDKKELTICIQGREFTVSPVNVFNSVIIQTT